MTEPPQRHRNCWTTGRVITVVCDLALVAYCLVRLATGHHGTETWIPLVGLLLVLASTLWDSRRQD